MKFDSGPECSYCLLVLAVTSSALGQAILDGCVQGAVLGILALGFGLILGVTGRFHFAFATTFVVGVYVAAEFADRGAPVYVGVAIGIVCATVLGVLIEWFLYRPLVRRVPELALLAVFVTALGVVIIGQNVLQLVYGTGSVTLGTSYTIRWVSFGGNLGLTTLDIVSLGVALVLTVAVSVFMLRTQYGRAIRAVQENVEMATAVGISSELVYVVVFAIGSALSAVGAVLLTQGGSARPDSGMSPTFNVLVVVFVAGLRATPLGFMVAAIAIGLLQTVSLLWLSPGWSPVLVFGVLFATIALKPYTAGIRRFSLRTLVSRRAPAAS